MGQPHLDAGTVHLRPWRNEDAEALVAAYSDPVIQQWHCRSMTFDEALQWVTDARAGWRDETPASWAIAADDGLAGRITLRPHLADGWAEAAYWVVAAARGRGVAPLALQTATNWAFQVLGLHRVELEHSTGNPASCRVALKAGFAAEGTKRSHTLHPDGWHDMHLHARIAAIN
ncbi:GNAT family N-acetyltransferase [Desertihabitans brevis]|nr:GNAT family N-acetyltransferase [Desertihabitans brevis]